MQGGENIDATIGGSGGRPKSQLVPALDGNSTQLTSRAEWICEYRLADSEYIPPPAHRESSLTQVTRTRFEGPEGTSQPLVHYQIPYGHKRPP